MRVGAQVSSAGGLVPAIGRATAIGAEVLQIFTQSPRAWSGHPASPETLARYRMAAAAQTGVKVTFCHATYLINLATANDELLGRSRACLLENLVAGTAIGSAGVVVHIGSHLGAGLAGVVGRVAEGILGVLDGVETRLGERSCPLLLENAAGAGGTVGRSFAELAEVLAVCDGDERLGVCLDTQHLFVSGVGYDTLQEADAVITELDATVGLGRLRCIHLNDSKVGLGSNRDRHENLGAGEIGEDALGALCSHPAIEHVPAVLEVPGAGNGPRSEDIATAKRIVADGRARRERSARKTVT